MYEYNDPTDQNPDAAETKPRATGCRWQEIAYDDHHQRTSR